MLYFRRMSGGDVEPTVPYNFIMWYGFETMGKLDGKLPAGDYKLWVVDQAGDQTKLGLHVYANL